jgi:hypothetical protein
MAPLYIVIILDADTASIKAILTINLAVISLIEILGVAFTEEDK